MHSSIKRVAVVSVVDPFPTDSGKRVMLAGFLEHLADRLDTSNVHYVLVGDRNSDAPDGFPVQLHQLRAPSAVHRLAGLLTRGCTGRASLQEALLHSPQLTRELAATLRQIGADLELYDTMRVGQYAGDGSAPRRICYLDDLLSQRYRLMLATMRRFSDVDIQPLGTFTEQVPSVLRPLAAHRHAQRALLAVERRLVRRSEDRAARTFDRCLLVSPEEVSLLVERATVAPDRVRAVPPWVRMAAPARRDYQGAPEFVFLGLLSAPHNEDGLCDFVRRAWPALLARRPDARLRVVGRQARPQLLGLVARHPHSVVLDGYVPNLDLTLNRAAAMINPLRFGTGIKIKVIEALGRGLPVVSSTIGANGIASGPRTGVFLADEVEHSVEALLRLTDLDVNHGASQDALAHFERVYARAAAFASYDSALGLVPRHTAS